MLDPVQLHAVLDLLGHPVTFSKGGFGDATDWTPRVVLRLVVAYDRMRDTAYVRPGGERLIEKTQKAQAMDRSALDALLQVLADHPRSPLGRTSDEIEKNVQAAFDAVLAQEA
jgi:hypothetical protein